MRSLGYHAVVLGAGMAGLLAARVLSDFYAAVTVVERDQLPREVMQRRGIPQGQHLHSLLSRGTQALEELFPGLMRELVAAGATLVDEGDLSRVYSRFGPYSFNRSQKFADPEALVFYLPSRPFLEFHIRSRVGALPNVGFLDGHDVVSPAAATPHRISGVRVVDRHTGEQSVLDADLVVDATGRAARTPAFLETLGHRRPPELQSAAHGTYFSQLLSIPAGMIADKLAMAFAGDGLPAGGLAAYENNTWVLTVTHLGSHGRPPADMADMLALARQFTPPSMAQGLRSAQPLGDVTVFRYPGGVWRRYDCMPGFPEGLLVVGDALCTLNPLWGQGMTLAALQALALRDCLRDGDRDVAGRFFRAASADIEPVWTMNENRDRPPSAPGTRPSMASRLARWGVGQALAAAEHDIVLTEKFVRVNHLIDPPEALRDPRLLARAVLGNLRRRSKVSMLVSTGARGWRQPCVALARFSRRRRYARLRS